MKTKQKGAVFSACKAARTAGRRYSRANDAEYANATLVAKAADAALARRGLNKKRRVSPAESFARALYFRQAGAR